MIQIQDRSIKIILIGAMNKNHVIGIDNHMPWTIKNDLKHFKELTINHTIIMGRKTYESIGGPLSNRKNIVISSNLVDNRVTTYKSLDEAFINIQEDEVFIIGGESIYNLSIDIADEIYLTYIDKTFLGDRFFPIIDLDKFKIIDQEIFHEELTYAFIHLIKR